jgi:hypothetical protein
MKFWPELSGPQTRQSCGYQNNIKKAVKIYGEREQTGLVWFSEGPMSI